MAGKNQNIPNPQKQFRLLGKKAKAYSSPSQNILETFPSPSFDLFYVSFEQRGEFTSLCPITGQPDFADIRILYRPDKLCVESKSLKLYLQSFRNIGAFGEAITNRIADDLVERLQPHFLVVIGDFKPRGGLAWKTEAIRTKGTTTTEDLPLTSMDSIALGKFR